MKVRIVCYQDVNQWIIGKIAIKLNEELKKLSIDSAVVSEPDYSADINHHLLYYDYSGKRTTTDTLMITHIDSLSKINMLKSHFKSAEMGICMSKGEVDLLTNTGIERKKLSYVNLAHDGVLKPRELVIGLMTNVYGDHRKREYFLPKLCEKISPKEFRFVIMGDGWKPIIDNITERGFKVEYYDSFNYDSYVNLVPGFDYYLYFGLDEGSIGFIDALAAGVPTIVTPQGYHLDVPNGLTYPFTTIEELIEVFEKIAEKKRSLTKSVSTWTWKNYASKHLEIWQYLLGAYRGNILSTNKEYYDGISSVRFENHTAKPNIFNKIKAFVYVQKTNTQMRLRMIRKTK